MKDYRMIVGCLLSLILLQGFSLSWSFVIVHQAPSPPCRQFSPLFHRRSFVVNRMKDDDDDDDEQGAPGMNDAFQKLDSLVESLGGDGGSKKEPTTTSAPVQSSISADKGMVPETGASETLTPEKEVQMYTKLMKDLETTDDDQLYSDVMEEMGGTPTTASDSPSKTSGSTVSEISSVFDKLGTDSTSNPDMEKFMDDALNEALKEVKLKSSDSLSSESILNDEKIMKEIEAIFDKGSAQLMESLEEIRKEQVRSNNETIIVLRG